MVNSEQFGKRLQKIMDEYDLNATSFADQVDVGRSSISHILSGRNKPSLEFVMKVIEAFPEVELYWLLNGKGQFPKKKLDAPSPYKTSISTDTSSYKLDFEQQAEETPSTPERQSDQAAFSTVSNSEPIERIVIFYTDGTFKSFIP